ncbi:MBL fold metallo-hydrolase [Ornithinibacillus xuwenensis]|uniref:MBL fold metallo-hydrolase n=1 Tax=Ornithinibacillus xuwenensis TaxID=3144668 RepID=A0ABU9XLZ2_9BACI
MMKHYICKTCGIQYNGSPKEPEKCVICTEERQYVHPSGQSWITLEEMVQNHNYQNEIIMDEKGLYSIHTRPSFGIGQTAYLVQNGGFNILWDCLTYLDEETIQAIEELGGIDAIALSHPHYYTTQVEWAEAFNALIYIHEDDQEWVTRPSDRIVFWSGETLELDKGIILHRLGGHYKGGAVLEWKEGNDEKGILLSGDIIQVVQDQDWVSFMYSYPNLIPLPAAKVADISTRVKQMKIDRIYNAFYRVVKEDGIAAVERSATRYIQALNGELFET